MAFKLLLKKFRIQFVTLLSLLEGCHASNCSRFLEPAIGCTCIGDLLMYECSTLGPGTTLWEGSVFRTAADCDSITLRHSQFGQGATSSCNNGGIVGRSVNAVSNLCYTSQLNVTIDSSLDGATVSCIHVSTDGVRREIGSNTITITPGQNSLPPPNNIQVLDIPNYVATQQLTFNWSSIMIPGWNSCPSAHYTITSIDCGNCADSTTTNHITCQNAVLGRTCSFVVRSVACGVEGDPSDSVSVVLKVPSAPSVHSVPLYDHRTTHLRSIQSIFKESEAFVISEGIDGSAVFYTILYTDALSGDVCNSTTIPASNCVHRMCQHVFEISSSMCSPFSNINITAFGTNLLGNGTMSNEVAIEFFNQRLQVKFSLLTLNVICVFLSPKTTQKVCSIAYGPGNPYDDCINSSLKVRSENSNNHTGLSSVAIKLPGSPQHYSLQNQFCFIITAGDVVSTVQVAGTFNAGCDPQQLSDGTHALSSDNAGCGPPLHSIGIKNGIVCYTGVDAGSTAFYSCSNCDSGAISSVRTCQLNGTWNGTMPQCGCAVQSSTLTLGFTISLSVVVLILVITSIVLIILVVMIIFLIRAKAKLQQKFEQATLYDEIGIPPSIIDSSKNVAYSSAIGHDT